ncbi:MAG: DUF4388 domain-containing protein [Fibrobacterota bacterium]
MQPYLAVPVIAGLTAGAGIVVGAHRLLQAFLRKRRRQSEEQTIKNTTFILKNDITAGHLREDLFALCEDRRTGVFHLTIGRRKGYLVFRDGSVLDIYYRESKGRPALARILSQKEGKYYFEPRAIHHPDVFHEDLRELISLYNESTGKFQIK